jgi:DNA-binding NarL/FixJ family response regulator
VERTIQLRDFTGAAVVVHSNRPDRLVSAVMDARSGCPPIVVLTNVRDPALAIETLRRGATSYLIAAECSRQEFLFSLVGTTAGHSSMSPSVTAALVQRIHLQAPRSGHEDPTDPLSTRDVAILNLLADGCTNMQIATRLCLAEKSVRNAVSRVYSKIQVGSRAEAIVWWINRRRTV